MIYFRISLFGGCDDKNVDVVRNACEARFILLRYMCEEKEEKNLPVLDARRPWLAKNKGIERNASKD